jgi:hypothetical protein
VRDTFEQEKPLLLPLPQNRFETDLVRPVVSGKQPYVRFDLNDYSIPPDKIRVSLLLVASESSVRIFDGQTEIARHRRSYDRRAVIEDQAHLKILGDQKRKARDLRGRDRLRSTCPSADAFIDALARRGDSLSTHTTRLASLLDRYGAVELEAAIKNALQRGAVSADSVAQILDQRARQRGIAPSTPIVLPDDPRVRDLRVTPHALGPYDALAQRDRRRTAMTTLTDQLNYLGLKLVASQLDDLVAMATKKRLGPVEILEHIAALETKERARRSQERRLSRSKIGRFKPIADLTGIGRRKSTAMRLNPPFGSNLLSDKEISSSSRRRASARRWSRRISRTPLSSQDTPCSS